MLVVVADGVAFVLRRAARAVRVGLRTLLRQPLGLCALPPPWAWGFGCGGDNCRFRRTAVIADGDLPPTKRALQVAMALEARGRYLK